jgi:long-chain acyl-CoA synthetase
VQHLLDFFDRYVRGRATALRYDDGLRRWSYTADQLRAAAEAFAGRLIEAGLQPGDRLVIWSDNCPEWVAAFWGCMLRGVAVIPVDARASDALVRRIVATVSARGIVAADDLEAPALPSGFVWRLRDVEWIEPGARPNPPRAMVGPDMVAEIVFTSGTTGDPKGVVITHGNIVANIAPVERTVARYRRYIWPLQPIRFLGLLPLSHMFGQALTIFLPPLVSAATVFIKGHNPGEIVTQIRRNRITLAVTVPRVLDLIRSRVQRLAPSCADPSSPTSPLIRRLWRYRQSHRLFGWKFCGFVVGGAQLDPDLEEFWRRLGFAVVQGYGLTETAPIVAWNNPFAMKHGTVGMPLDGVDVRIAPDGEVVVRGASVTAGYLGAPESARSAFEAGWFHTGDLGSFDESGHLLIRGRKKDEIVTAEGVHVVPDEVERVLEGVPGVREAAVVGRTNGGERVHAVLVLQPGADAAAVIRQANATLHGHQRIQDFSVWAGAALPRTEAIGKLKRGEIRTWVAEGAPPQRPAAPAGAEIERLLAPYARSQPLGSQTTLAELGLTSLDRVELAMAIEEQAGIGVSEVALAESRTVADLRSLLSEAAPAAPAGEALAFPRWARSPLARAVRDVSQRLWILPLARPFLRLRVDGREHLDGLRGPVIFAANHQSHLDTPTILLCLPSRWRRRLAVAMAKEFFDAYFTPSGHRGTERLTLGALYGLAVLFFNAFPLPRTEPGARDVLRYVGELASAGWSTLIFPEGHRTERGEISPFQPGVGMLASRLRLPVVPVRLDGLDRVLHHTWRWPRRGSVHVTFGAPLRLEGDDYAALARHVEEAVAGAPNLTPCRAPSLSREP